MIEKIVLICCIAWLLDQGYGLIVNKRSILRKSYQVASKKEMTKNSADNLDTASLNESISWNPYEEILDMNKPLTTSDSNTIFTENTLTEATDVLNIDQLNKKTKDLVLGQPNKDTIRNRREKPWFWDDFLEKELGDLDGELSDGEDWIEEMRNIVEQKRGFAIWTDRSTDEILKEAKKSQAASSMSVPPNVALVLTAVYLDRTVTLKEIRAEEDLLYMEYRKWFRERRKQLKKDPVPMSAAQLSREWLLRHPTKGGAASANRTKLRIMSNIFARKPPASVFDELTEKMDILPATALALQREQQSKGIYSPPAVAIAGTSNSKSPLSTPSVVNWDKSRDELLESTSNPSSTSFVATTSSTVEPVFNGFRIDDEEMFVANSCYQLSVTNSRLSKEDAGYFVVL